jgi:uncharacterized DUF497 family protein
MRYEYYTTYIHSALRVGRRENRRNKRRHGGISFELATLVFEDERCLLYLDRMDNHTGEQRRIALGMATCSGRRHLASGCARVPGG